MHNKSYYNVIGTIERMWNLFTEPIAWIDDLAFTKISVAFMAEMSLKFAFNFTW